MDKGFLGYGSVRGAKGYRDGQPAGSRFAEPVIDCDFRKRRALEICADAQALHFKGQTAKAIPIYAKSIRLQPTAEAHAFLGWAYSAHSRYDLAIQECLAAIHIDPEYGNSYNDIGSYYVSQGKLDEAIGWFERAKKATRYESRHFPFLNLGRVFEAKGMGIRAIREFERALEIEPGEESCLVALKRLRKSLVRCAPA
jgi:Tfp pilus assembly protein PilF